MSPRAGVPGSRPAISGRQDGSGQAPRDQSSGEAQVHRRVWLAVVALCVAMVGLLYLNDRWDGGAPVASTGEAGAPDPSRASAADPSRGERASASQRAPSSAPGSLAPPSGQEPGRDRDPGVRTSRDRVVAALPGGHDTSALVFEAASLRSSPIGQMLIDCLHNQVGRAPLALFRDRTGVDLLEDLHHVAVSREGVVFGGRFDRARFDPLLTGAGMSARPYGTDGRIYLPAAGRRWVRPDGVEMELREAWGTWRDEVVVLGLGEGEVERAIDRLEGRLPSDPAIRPDAARSGIHGVVYPSDLARFFPPDQQAFLNGLAAVAERIELNLDISQDVALGLEVRGEDPTRVAELGRFLGTAINLARTQARSEGRMDMADLLERANLTPEDRRLRLDMAMPQHVVEERLAACRQP